VLIPHAYNEAGSARTRLQTDEQARHVRDSMLHGFFRAFLAAPVGRFAGCAKRVAGAIESAFSSSLDQAGSPPVAVASRSVTAGSMSRQAQLGRRRMHQRDGTGAPADGAEVLMATSLSKCRLAKRSDRRIVSHTDASSRL